MFSLNLKGNLLRPGDVMIMGILNITPDSFFTSNWQNSKAAIIAMVDGMVKNGMDIIDVGGQSTRPGSERISEKEELSRILPVIQMIQEEFPSLPVSVDTYQCRVAEEAVNSGASIINDISGGDMDNSMIKTVAALGVPYICMHMQGRPETMQENPVYDDVASEVLRSLAYKIDKCLSAGIKDIIIDPGFGFGKNINHNFRLLNRLSDFQVLGKPIMAGLSRKSTVFRTLGITPAGSKNGTTVMNTIAILNGANIVRVHDVLEANEVRKLIHAYKKAAS
ncbi:MAG: dihydropteroate synthase [Chitinophagaceae bacterium]|nr:MAG: dihydropteroate synthase [Chitinophagaceae bacterium]